MQSESTSRKIEQRCPRCGLIFYSEKPDALCPACLLATTLDVGPVSDEPAFWEDRAPARPTHLRTFSHFEILDELGRGGMGVVYRARDLNTERIVALKVLQAHHLEVPDLVQRFRSEVRAVSSLDHNHVLPIHEVGEHDGIPFFSMKLTTGQSLAHRIGNYLGKPREAAQLLAKISRGVQHAHERGILHRDLKPGNILLDAAGEPFVCDFGLAKWIEDDKKLTVTAAVLGTPHYIAPEQASGSKGLTTAVDIYSLGAILYELLTGRPPFVGGTVLETLLASQDHSPERPSSIARNVPRDLETICLKALQREPAARYPTAAAFADDLENWLAGRPINARPVSSGEQLWRWAKRNPLPAALASSLLLVLIVTAIGALYSAEKLKTSLGRAVAAESAAKERLYQSLVAQARATRRTGTAGQRYLAMEALRQAAAVRKDPELRAEVIAALSLYDLEVERRWKVRENALKQPIRFNGNLTRLYVADPNGDIKVQSIREPFSTSTLQGNGSQILALTTSGAHYIAARSSNEEIVIWRDAAALPVQTLKNHPITVSDARWVRDFCFSMNDQVFASLSNSGDVEIYDTSSWRLIKTIKNTIDQNIIALSRDGKLIAVTGRESSSMTIFQTATSEGKAIHINLPAKPRHVDISPDNTNVAVGCADYNIYLIAIESGSVIKSFSGHRQDITQVRFSHQGEQLASTARDNTLRLWDCRTSEQQVVLGSLSSESTLEFSADDTHLSTSGFSLEAAILKVYGGTRTSISVDAPYAHDFANLVSSVDCSGESGLVATASYRGISVYELKSLKKLGELALKLVGNIDPVHDERSVKFLDRGTKLLVASRDRPPTIYAVEHLQDRVYLNKLDSVDIGTGYILGSNQPFDTAFLCFTNLQGEKALIFDMINRRTAFSIENQKYVWDMTCDPKLKWIVTAYTGKGSDQCLVWDPKTFLPVNRLDTGADVLLSLNSSATVLETNGYGGDRLWKTGNWVDKGPLQLQGSPADFDGVSYAHRPGLAAIATKENVVLYNDTLQHVLTTLESHILNARLTFSSDDNFLVAQGADNSVTVWNLALIRNELQRLNLDW